MKFWNKDGRMYSGENYYDTNYDIFDLDSDHEKYDEYDEIESDVEYDDY